MLNQSLTHKSNPPQVASLTIQIFVCLAGFLGYVSPPANIGLSQDTSISPPQREWKLPKGVTYSFSTKTAPRPLQIHTVEIRLDDVGSSLRVAAGPDPDGDGPAEVALMAPQKLAADSRFIAAINTCAWSMIPDKSTGKTPGYIVDEPSDLKGWVFDGQTLISKPEHGFWSCWLDKNGRCQIGLVDSSDFEVLKEAQWAISGFGSLLKKGRMQPAPSEVLHPRTAIGTMNDGRTMVWMIVDGRQKGLSEGVSEEELARLMAEVGCIDAINLDGGGSSILLLNSFENELSVVNKPSGGTPRPIPAMLGISESVN